MRNYATSKASLILAYYVYFGLLRKRGELQGLHPAPVDELLRMTEHALTILVKSLRKRLRLL